MPGFELLGRWMSLSIVYTAVFEVGLSCHVNPVLGFSVAVMTTRSLGCRSLRLIVLFELSRFT